MASFCADIGDASFDPLVDVVLNLCILTYLFLSV